MRNTCKIFKCKFQSLATWIKTYKNKLTRKNIVIKYTNHKYILSHFYFWSV